MAAAILEEISPEMLPLSLKESCVLPSESEELQSPGPVTMLDWRALLSPSRQSCIKLSNVEPCVNKAVAHLTTLKDRLTECNPIKNRPPITAILHENSRVVSSSDESRQLAREAAKPILVQRDSSNRFSSGQMSQLMIEGVTTGILVEKQTKPTGATKSGTERKMGWPDGEEVISTTLSLIARLELDRQDTIESLCQERVRVQQLGVAYDKECERRLDLLEVAVQKEHEECLQDLQELKWHVHLETRTLNKVLGELKLVVDKNERLKNDVDKMTKNSPLLEEKLIIENDHMAEIAHTQQETSDQLNKAKHKLMQTEDKSSKAHGRADSERQQMEIALNGIRTKLITAKKKLKEARLDAMAMTHQINDNLKKITENEKQARDLDEKHGKSMVLQSTVDTRVGLLKDNYVQMDMEHRRQEQRIENLRKQKEEEHSKLESEYILIKSGMQTEDRRLRQARDKNLEMEQENDSLSERIALFVKQTQDDEKSVERAHRELVKLDQQLGVSMAQFTEIRDNHFNASEEFKSEQAKAGDFEHTLKASILKLQQQIKEQTRTKVTYSGKVNAVSAELEKVRAESKRKEERVGRLARESETQSKGQTDKVAKLEETHSEKAKLLESLQSELSSVQAQQYKLEQEVGGRRDSLATDERQLRDEVQEKVSVVNSVSDRINVLERKLEDVVKSTAMLDKMEGVTNATIEQLNGQLSLLKEKLAAERKEEQSWRDELREISDFSSDAEQKHAAYLKERTQLLKQYKLDLHKALSTNATLAEHYRQQQVKFIHAKTLALRVIERKLEMESSLRDHKQLLAFQSCIYSTMRAYYEHRGVSCRKQVVQFHSQSKENMQQLRSLREQFETVIAVMHEFLENGLHKRTRTRSVDHAAVKVL